jgi:hypothetical protein
MLPIKNFSSFIIFLGAFNPSVLGLYKAVPVGPIWILHFNISFFIGVSLFKADELVQIS